LTLQWRASVAAVTAYRLRAETEGCAG